MKTYLERMPLVAILRGVRPDEVEAIGDALYEAGFCCIEVPLNSPEPFASIRRLRGLLPDDCLIGAGTVLQAAQVEEVQAAGGELIVMPHGDPAVIRAAKARDLYCAPGVATPTEGFAALAAGADVLKLFPAEQLGPPVLKAWRAVFPATLPMLPVGGITPENMAIYWAAGAGGFGLGSALYQAGLSASEVRARAEAFATAARRLPRRA